MSSNRKKALQEQNDIALKNFNNGKGYISGHPLFSMLWDQASITRCTGNGYGEGWLAVVDNRGHISCNSKLRAEPAQWARAIAHCLLHLGMEHFQAKERPIEWNIACDCVVEKFLTDLKFGAPFYDKELPLGVNDETRLYKRLCEMAEPASAYIGFGTAGVKTLDMEFFENRYDQTQWGKIFALGLASAVREAVNEVSGHSMARGGAEELRTRAYEAKQWFISSYPLLGAIAANFKLIEDPFICQRMEIRVAAISPFLSELYI
ncbi:MAG: hypothetical protein LBV04_10230, partial [Deferribacteraceae bacterium]|nr:hypothetical protein [Deferribacteraceae bacterium]